MKKTLIPLLLFAISITANSQVTIHQVYNWQDTTLPSSLIFDNTYNEIWGYTKDNLEYAIMGSTNGTHFFDITDTNNIAQIDFIGGAFQGVGIIHRDYHDYNGYLYMVSDEGPSTLQIADLRALPDSVSLVYDIDTLFSNVHNIFIDESTGLLYACSVTQTIPPNFSAMRVYDLSDPVSPQLIYTLNDAAISVVHDIYVEDHIAYMNCGLEGLFIYDFKDPSAPQMLGSLTTYTQQGYNHSGWLLDDGKHYVFADETNSTQLKVVNVEDFSDMQVVSVFGTANALSSPHNVIIENCLAFVSYYYDGLRVYDLTDPSNPVEIAFFDTYPDPFGASGYEGAWGVYPFLSDNKVLVSDMQTGMYLFKVNLNGDRPSADFTYSISDNNIQMTHTSPMFWDEYEWDFNNGTNSSLANPIFAVNGPGTYPVCLWVENSNGCDYKCDSIQIFPTGIDQSLDDDININAVFRDTYLILEFTVQKSTSINASVFDLTGKSILESDLGVVNGNVTLDIPVGDLSQAVYAIVLQTPGKIYSFKVANTGY